MTDIKLKERCQFCGGVGQIESHKDWQDGVVYRHTPVCENPDCVGAFIDTYYDTPEQAAKAWDRRALSTEINTICSFCEKKLTECARPLFKGKGNVFMCCECFKNFATKFFLKVCDKIGDL